MMTLSTGLFLIGMTLAAYCVARAFRSLSFFMILLAATLVGAVAKQATTTEKLAVVQDKVELAKDIIPMQFVTLVASVADVVVTKTAGQALCPYLNSGYFTPDNLVALAHKHRNPLAWRNLPGIVKHHDTS